MLQVCGRSHGLADVEAALAAVVAAAPASWSLDLISGANWRSGLPRAQHFLLSLLV